MKNTLLLASASLLTGMAIFFLALQSDPFISADIQKLDPFAFTRFNLVILAGAILVIIAFVLFALAITKSKD